MAVHSPRATQLDDELIEDVQNFIELLNLGAATLTDHLENETAISDPRFLIKALHEGRGYIKWAENVKHHENQHTMPLTNTSSASDLIGYTYRASSSGTGAKEA